MAESEYTQQNLAYIRTHVDNLERMVRFQIAANPHSREAVQEQLNGRAGAADVYLLIASGPKTLDELVAARKSSKPTISKICTYLYDCGLIFKVPHPANVKQIAFTVTDLEQMLGVSKLAKQIAGK